MRKEVYLFPIIGVSFLTKWYEKSKGMDLGVEPFRTNLYRVPPTALARGVRTLLYFFSFFQNYLLDQGALQGLGFILFPRGRGSK